MLIGRAQIAGGPVVDVRIAGEKIVEMAPRLSRRSGEAVIDAAGGALLPGLHDHHLHLFALAAAEGSVRCGPPDVRDEADLARALGEAPRGSSWIRGVGYFESVAGALGREQLDRLVPDRPLRIQHRSGSLWMLNSAAAERLGLDRGEDAPGVERDGAGRATGRLLRCDAWLRERLGGEDLPGLAATSLRLAAFGVTGVTDATAGSGARELRAFIDAVGRGELLQRVVVLGAPSLPDPGHAQVLRGAVKLRLDESDLGPFEDLVTAVRSAHDAGRCVAIHAVTRAELVLAAAAIEDAGALRGDRIEHAAVSPPEVTERLAALSVAVVTQPGFVNERGDAYLSDVDPRDLPWLIRGRGFIDAGVPLAAGTDAPFGDPDPWRAMQAAVDRRTEASVVLGAEERLTPEEALALFTKRGTSPGGPPRSVAPGEEADLCLLDRPWERARERLSSDGVVATLRGGVVTWRRDTDRGTSPNRWQGRA